MHDIADNFRNRPPARQTGARRSGRLKPRGDRASRSARPGPAGRWQARVGGGQPRFGRAASITLKALSSASGLTSRKARASGAS